MKCTLMLSFPEASGLVFCLPVINHWPQSARCGDVVWDSFFGETGLSHLGEGNVPEHAAAESLAATLTEVGVGVLAK